MVFASGPDKTHPVAQLPRDILGRAPKDVQAAAPVRPIGPKRSDDDVAALRDRPVERIPIQNAIRRINEEMENRAAFSVPRLSHAGPLYL